MGPFSRRLLKVSIHLLSLPLNPFIPSKFIRFFPPISQHQARKETLSEAGAKGHSTEDSASRCGSTHGRDVHSCGGKPVSAVFSGVNGGRKAVNHDRVRGHHDPSWREEQAYLGCQTPQQRELRQWYWLRRRKRRRRSV
jgi:hypothetical protein